MQSVFFQGRARPNGKRLTIEEGRTRCIGPLNFDLIIRIVDSAVTVECEIEEYKDCYFTEIYIQAYKLAHALIDVASFWSGVGWRLSLEQFSKTPGVWEDITVQDETLSGLCDAYDLQSLNDLLPLLSEPPFLVVLNDLVQTIGQPDFVVVHSARAVEGIKHLITPGEVSDPKKWEAMRTALNVDLKYLQSITGPARKPRHGEWVPVSPTNGREVLQRAWRVMNRYITYRLRGSHPLEAPEFAQLQG